MASSAITATNLSHAYYDERQQRSVVALSGVSFSVEEGEFVSIVGPSGCGKSTLLRLLAGLESVVMGGITVRGGRPGMVFQDQSLFPWLTVEENVAYPLRVAGAAAAQWAEPVARLLELCGLADFRRAYPHQLSGGMKQRAAVARALAADRPVLLMDEPFGALDEQTRLLLQQELLRVWERSGKTVVFITHSVEEALVLSDRVLVMSHRPGRMLQHIVVPFERPRNVIELRRSPRFGELSYEIWRLLGLSHDNREAA
ncbi:MAG: ABC transporter ATP-binding protein [Ottowia sp.]|uniref:ABC transporter ATP-binding protein n=1 Tax=Ottowia sp. TaxID=1898956 RepID=UPI003C7625AF